MTFEGMVKSQFPGWDLITIKSDSGTRDTCTMSNDWTADKVKRIWDRSFVIFKLQDRPCQCCFKFHRPMLDYCAECKKLYEQDIALTYA